MSNAKPKTTTDSEVFEGNFDSHYTFSTSGYNKKSLAGGEKPIIRISKFKLCWINYNKNSI